VKKRALDRQFRFTIPPQFERELAFAGGDFETLLATKD
jgi:hypothetical protein